MNNFIKKQLIGMAQGVAILTWLPGILLINSCNGGLAPNVPNNNNVPNIHLHQELPNNLVANELIVFCGNPGVGKSSLCNSIFQGPIFKSGLSVGTGLTMEKQEHIYEGKLYIDTPGLSDVERRQQAAREIEQALRQNNNYKIVFVAKLDGARIRPADLLTINTVCDAIQTDFEYGLIFNQVGHGAINRINAEGGLERYLSTLNKQPRSTVILKKNSAMDEEEDVYFDNDSEERMMLMNFISELGANRILDREVQDIDVRDFQVRIEELEQSLRREEEERRRQQEIADQQRRELEQERLRNKYSASDVLQAINNRNYNKLQEILQLNGNLIDTPNHLNQTPLQHAAWNGSSQIVQLLLDKGANVKNVDRTGWTTIMSACGNAPNATSEHVNILRWLMDRGANIHHFDNGGHHALCYIYNHGRHNQHAMLMASMLRTAGVKRSSCNCDWP